MLSDPLRRKCPHCGELEGNRCHDDEGELMDGFHLERIVDGPITTLHGTVSNEFKRMDAESES